MRTIGWIVVLGLLALVGYTQLTEKGRECRDLGGVPSITGDCYKVEVNKMVTE